MKLSVLFDLLQRLECLYLRAERGAISNNKDGDSAVGFVWASTGMMAQYRINAAIR